MPYKDPEKQRAYQRESVARARSEWISVNGPCPCGSWENLQVDHIDPTLKISHNVWSWAPLRRAEELAKCQVLCKKHHKEKTLSQMKRTTHGKKRMYELGCRCEKCRETKSIENAKRVRKHRNPNGEVGTQQLANLT